MGVSLAQLSQFADCLCFVDVLAGSYAWLVTYFHAKVHSPGQSLSYGEASTQ